jgi:ubiquinone/menaquinone biosynthesis C-methylase UbiE
MKYDHDTTRFCRYCNTELFFVERFEINESESRSSGLNRFIARQLSNPSGLGGRAVSSVMSRQNRPLYEETIRLLSPSDTDSVLDIGCGNGYVLNMFANRFDCTLTGIDISPSAIKFASKRNRKFIKSGRMNFIRQDMNKTPFSDCTFDKIYTINTVYFWKNLNDTMEEIRRVLKPGGLFINSLFTNETLSRFSHTKFGYKRYTPEQLTSENDGFTIDVVSVFSGKAYCVLYRKEI